MSLYRVCGLVVYEYLHIDQISSNSTYTYFPCVK